ncbi:MULTISPECIES: uroporphyrinogen decarboxylase [unclassified Thiomonas]|uniref:uroporphyrinogen decarboxylase n=1 Tax=unclassified Thiomonas TaxID=2625466 RepID=UPI0004DBB4E3|nr:MULTISPECIES: uroporphyrinogen decarboxylase [unclassified Thiomonas]CDW93491.1 uroporphyrinogen decarboxylase [Thiomonas sp. CB2]VDY05102.1 uroporphyrinogen decarboxylase [Thiomonas sp. Bio17B3]VDY07733.1 uroporphyrinogen decarboxylase [Thiomonas sp. Sup16B3]VDY13348.1 Uroporphyrinogen decarboxylase (URO-D) (UPD) [Thiomonas sp. OC7]VDY17444.1 uroporphyrinogen decarboxylase [Thiomonas sp. CB2]
MTAPIANDTFLRALRRQPTDYTPLWLMRQAGRYLPEYNATRTRAGSFLSLAQNPHFATEVTLQPIDRYALDAAILFSDILTVPDAMGLGLRFEAGEGPKFDRPLRTEADVAALAVPDMDKLRYVFDAVSEIRRALVQNGTQRVPLIGFSGSPWTLACYMVEGGGSDDYRTVKTMLYSRPDLMHRILAVNAEAVAQYLAAQIDAGAQAVMIFDSWGGVLADGAFQEFSLAYSQQVIAALKQRAPQTDVPVILFTKGGGQWLEAMADTGADALGLDWTTSLAQARARVGQRVALQGNLDPNVLFAPPAAIEKEVQRLLHSFGPVGAGAGHVFNLGHGISQFTPPEHVSALVEAVHTHSRALHRSAS